MQSFGWTALHWAADRGLLEVTNVLLDYEADVNVRDLNEATPLMAAARTNALATARALLARGGRVDLTDEWGDSALDIATNHHHVKMMWQLKAALRGPLDRMRCSKVIFSCPPSMSGQLMYLVEEARKVKKGGDGVYGVAQNLRLAVDVVNKEQYCDGDEDGVPSSPESSPTRNKVAFSGQEVSWLNACMRSTLAVQVAPESEEYQQDAICQEQARLLEARVRLENLRHSLKKSEEDTTIYEEDTRPEFERFDEDTPLKRVREGIAYLQGEANRLKMRIRTADNHFVHDRGTLRRLELVGPEGQTYRDDRQEMLNGLINEVTSLEGEVEPLLEEVHRLLELRRHVLLQESIAQVEDGVVKTKGKIRPVPKEPNNLKELNAKEQETFKADVEKTKADNAKCDETIEKLEKQKVRLNAKLKDDLRTLEKPNPPPTFLMTLSARAFARMDPTSFIMWLNWQTESNGFPAKKQVAKKEAPPLGGRDGPIFNPDEHDWTVPTRRVSL